MAVSTREASIKSLKLFSIVKMAEKCGHIPDTFSFVVV